MLEKHRLSGKRLVVTGAARGIGEWVTRVAAARGARLALVGPEADRLRDLADELGNGASWWAADDGTALKSAIDGCADHMGGVDLVLANAGVAADGTVRQIDEASFERVLDVNVNGVFRTLKYAAPHLERSRGHVMVVASAMSFTPLAGLASYGASKAGVELLTLAYRQEVAHLGITVGLVHPSWIDTDLVRGADADLPSFQGLRQRLPYPGNVTTSVDRVVEAIVGGLAHRRGRIYVPRAVGVANWTKAAVNSPLTWPWMRRFATRSDGGYGLLITGNVMVDRTQLGEPGNVVIEDERDLDALIRWAKSAKDGGVPIWVQLNHPGRQANPLALRQTPVAPSAIALSLPGATTPRELTSEEIEDIIERFAAAAVVCETAGFDGVQVHGAHGYLVAQFLSPLSNQRDDAWGGDLERRMRFVLEVVRRIRGRVSPGFAVGVKLNSADFQRGGFTEEESGAVVAALAHEGLDLIEVSGGSYEQPAMMGVVGASTRAREAYFLEYARTVRDLAGDTPLAVTGGFRCRIAMDGAIRSGECDVVGLGRPTATTPDAADVILSGRAETLTAHQMRSGMRRALGKVTDLKTLDGLLDLGWHADQLHRVAAGLEPDLDRGQLATTLSLLRRHGRDTFRRKRGA